MTIDPYPDIKLLTAADGVSIPDAKGQRTIVTEQGLTVRILSIEHLFAGRRRLEPPKEKPVSEGVEDAEDATAFETVLEGQSADDR